jgi:DNA-directed RNA polymerase subunit RPC12/RpoP
MSDKRFDALIAGLTHLIQTVTQLPVEEEAPVAKKRGRPKKAKPTKTKSLEEEVPLEELAKKKKKLKKVKRTVDEDETETKIAKKTGRTSKKFARKVRLTAPKGGRPNLFLTMPEYNAHKEDTKIDKLLWKGRTPTIRRDSITTKVEIDCLECGTTCEAHPDEISSEGRYRCNDCVVGRGPADSSYDDEE